MKNILYIIKKNLISNIKCFYHYFITLCICFFVFVLFLSGCGSNGSNVLTVINTASSYINNDIVDITDNTTVIADTTIDETTVTAIDSTIDETAVTAVDSPIDKTTVNIIDNTTIPTTNAVNTNNNVVTNNNSETTTYSNDNLNEISTTKSGNISYEEATTSASYNNIPTLLSFLKNAIMPVGTTMYIWGGGWNEADTGAGLEAMSIGLSPAWINFYNSQNSSYNHEFHRYEIHNGLDCSGYVGWVLYNTFGNKYSNTGYVYKSSTITSKLSSMGFGNYITSYTYDFKPGDICSMAKHVWICLGTCNDGSVLVLHSSPPGVRLCGTLLSDGSVSEAVLLAQETMQKYYPNWYSRYPNCNSNYNFITTSSKLRMYESTLQDPDGLRNYNAYQIIDYLFTCH